MSAALVVRDDAKLTVAWTPDALAMKDSALEVSALVGRVSNADENNAATDALAEINRLLKLAEATRKECKAPVLAFGQRIDDSFKAFSMDLERDKHRLGKLQGDYAALELAKQRAAEAARRLEEEKLQREREQEERRIREEAEAKQRKLHEEEDAARRQAAAARNAKEREEALARQAELDRQKALAEAKTHKELEAVQERTNQAAAALPGVTKAEKAEGQSVFEEWVIEQIDSFVLMRARPDLVRKVEFDTLAVKAALTASGKLPGVTARKEVKSRVRAARGPMTLELSN